MAIKGLTLQPQVGFIRQTISSIFHWDLMDRRYPNENAVQKVCPIYPTMAVKKVNSSYYVMKVVSQTFKNVILNAYLY
jgi:hypothetical protein